MNYLAHAFLSPRNTSILLGNMACDMVRPGDKGDLDNEILKGMDLHQRIDRFTDSHSGFIRTRNCLNRDGLPYAGVLVDILFDYFLALHWKDYSSVEIKQFSAGIYRILLDNSHRIPGHFSRMTDHMCSEDWFGTFHTVEGLKTALKRLNYRSSRVIPVERIISSLEMNRNVMESGFRSLMKDLCREFNPPYSLIHSKN